MNRLIAIVISIVVSAGGLVAQSRRAPTPAEAAALAAFRNALLPLLDRFADANWKKDEDSFRDPAHESISVHAGVPLDDCFGGWRTYRVIANSARFNQLLLPLYQRAQTLTQGLAEKMRAGTVTDKEMAELKQINEEQRRLSQVKVEVCGNSPNIQANRYLPDVPSLLPGVVAHKVAADSCEGNLPCYVLVYGDWKSGRYSRARGLYDFTFVHPPASPYIENIIVTISGADDRIQELLKTLDWTRLNDALSHESH